MSEKGIKELSELAEFVCELGNGLGKSLEDGKISLADALHFTKAALAAPKAFMGIGQVSEEYFDMSDAEQAELKALVAAKLDLPQEGVETIVENIINAAVELNLALAAIIQKKKA